MQVFFKLRIAGIQPRSVGSVASTIGRPPDHYFPHQKYYQLSGQSDADCIHEPMPLWILQPSDKSMRMQPRTGSKVLE